MGNARWTGVPPARCVGPTGVKAGAVAVRFKDLDQPFVDGAPDYMKSLDLDDARDGACRGSCAPVPHPVSRIVSTQIIDDQQS
jgi:DMSO/TMAO reductase YedYZ molybdopterin-dependent catalytic subunit